MSIKHIHNTETSQTLVEICRMLLLVVLRKPYIGNHWQRRLYDEARLLRLLNTMQLHCLCYALLLLQSLIYLFESLVLLNQSLILPLQYFILLLERLILPLERLILPPKSLLHFPLLSQARQRGTETVMFTTICLNVKVNLEHRVKHADITTCRLTKDRQSC